MGCDGIDVVKHWTATISTHTSRVGCDANTANNCIVQGISTHTSRVGCDGSSVALVGTEKKFLLTHPVWDVTPGQLVLLAHPEISTHTSRVGCD